MSFPGKRRSTVSTRGLHEAFWNFPRAAWVANDEHRRVTWLGGVGGVFPTPVGVAVRETSPNSYSRVPSGRVPPWLWPFRWTRLFGIPSCHEREAGSLRSHGEWRTGSYYGARDHPVCYSEVARGRRRGSPRTATSTDASRLASGTPTR